MEEYADLVKQAVYEVEDLRAAIEYDEEFMGGAETFIDRLDSQIRKLHDSFTDGSYRFGEQDLPFMSIVRRVGPQLLPFKTLLVRINDTHTQGIENVQGNSD